MPITLEQITIGTPGAGAGDQGHVFSQKINDNAALIAAAIEDAERKAYVIPVTAEDGEVTTASFVKFRMPYAFVLLEVRASLNTAESGTDIVVGISSGGSIFNSGDTLEIPAGSTTSVGNSPAPDVRYVLLQDNASVSITVDSAASGGSATGLKVYLIGYVIETTF